MLPIELLTSPIRFIALILRSLVETYMQPRYAGACRAEPNGRGPQFRFHDLADQAPKGMLLWFRCFSYESREVTIGGQWTAGTRDHEGRIVAQIGKSQHGFFRVCRGKLLAKRL